MSKKQGKNKRVAIFKLVSISLPFLGLFLLEALLSVFNYGANYDLFIPYDQAGTYLMFNPEASKAYFNNAQFATTGNRELFKKNKDSDTFRIFVLGESTTIGYPYFHNGSFHRWLQFKLDRLYPAKKFEIINLSLTAVNSYTVLGFSKELIKYDPDAVLIYTGHNEYYGAMGVASSEIVGSNPTLVNLFLQLKRLKTVQLISNTYQGLKSQSAQDQTPEKATRMELMVGDDKISLQSELYQKGIDQFEFNMSKIFNLFQKQNIPVFAGNLVSNEKDLKPFLETREVMSPEFNNNLKCGEEAFNFNKLEKAKYCFSEANSIFSDHALCNFYLGKLAFKEKDWTTAQRHFLKAKELDGLRFRAPVQLNTVLSSLAAEYKNVELVDVVTAFKNQSEGGIVGDNLMVDHVHPNLKGFAIMSEAYYSKLEESNLLPELSNKDDLSLNVLLENMPITKLDSILGAYRIHLLKSSWPYNEPEHKSKLISETYEQHMAMLVLKGQIDWRKAQDSLYAYYNKAKQKDNVAKVVEAIVLENPNDPDFYASAINLNAELGHMDKAVFYATKSFYLKPSYVRAKNIYTYMLNQDRPEEAKPFIEYCIEKSYADKQLLVKDLKVIEKIIEQKQELAKSTDNIDLYLKIIDLYTEVRNLDAMQIYIDKILSIDPNNDNALSLKKNYNL